MLTYSLSWDVEWPYFLIVDPGPVEEGAKQTRGKSLAGATQKRRSADTSNAICRVNKVVPPRKAFRNVEGWSLHKDSILDAACPRRHVSKLECVDRRAEWGGDPEAH